MEERAEAALLSPAMLTHENEPFAISEPHGSADHNSAAHTLPQGAAHLAAAAIAALDVVGTDDAELERGRRGADADCQACMILTPTELIRLQLEANCSSIKLAWRQPWDDDDADESEDVVDERGGADLPQLADAEFDAAEAVSERLQRSMSTCSRSASVERRRLHAQLCVEQANARHHALVTVFCKLRLIFDAQFQNLTHLRAVNLIPCECGGIDGSPHASWSALFQLDINPTVN